MSNLSHGHMFCSTPLTKSKLRNRLKPDDAHTKKQIYETDNKIYKLIDKLTKCMKTKKRLEKSLCIESNKNFANKEENSDNFNTDFSLISNFSTYHYYSSIEKARKKTMSELDFTNITDNVNISMKSSFPKSLNNTNKIDYKELFLNDNSTDILFKGVKQHGDDDNESILDITNEDKVDYLVSQEIHRNSLKVTNNTIDREELQNLNFNLKCSSSTNLLELSSFKSKDLQINHQYSNITKSSFHEEKEKNDYNRINDRTHRKVKEWLGKKPMNINDSLLFVEMVDNDEQIDDNIYSVSEINGALSLESDLLVNHPDQNVDDLNGCNTIYDMDYQISRIYDRHSGKVIEELRKTMTQPKIYIDDDEGMFSEEQRPNSSKNDRNIESLFPNKNFLYNQNNELDKKTIIENYRNRKTTIENDEDDKENSGKNDHFQKNPTEISDYEDGKSLQHVSCLQASKLLNENKELREILRSYKTSGYPNMDWNTQLEKRIASNKRELNKLIRIMNKTMDNCDSTIRKYNNENNRLRDIIIDQSAIVTDIYPMRNKFYNGGMRR